MKQGLFFSKCSGRISDELDLEALALRYKDIPSVRVFDDFYDPDDFGEILREVEMQHLDSLVLAGESPQAFKQMRNGDHLFTRLAERGVNRNRIEMVNLINLAVRPHTANRDHVLEKAKLLVDVGLEKVKDSHDVEQVEISPRRAVAIVGANSSSISVAQHLLDEGYKVFVIHSGMQLTLSDTEAQHMQPTMAYVLHHPRFVLYHRASIEDFHGFTGDYLLQIKSETKIHDLPVGAVVLAPEKTQVMLKELQAIFHIDLDDNGKLAARDETTARSQTMDRGIFVVNPIESEDNPLGNQLQAADATAAAVINLLNRNEIEHRVATSQVNETLCGGCGACVKTCMFHAVSLSGSPPLSSIDPRRCRGCGNCVTACPAGARDLVVCPNTYLFNGVEILSRFEHAERGTKVLLLACEGCGYHCLDNAAESGLTWPIGVMPLGVVCGGQIDTQLIMHAFTRDFDGVALLICGEGCCHNLIGNLDLERRVNLFKDIMHSRGLVEERIRIISTCSRSGESCVEQLDQFCKQLSA